jgi:hypothetical protein
MATHLDQEAAGGRRKPYREEETASCKEAREDCRSGWSRLGSLQAVAGTQSKVDRSLGEDRCPHQNVEDGMGGEGKYAREQQMVVWAAQRSLLILITNDAFRADQAAFRRDVSVQQCWEHCSIVSLPFTRKRNER